MRIDNTQLALILLLIAVNRGFAVNPNCKNQNAPANTEARLRNDLFCDYDQSMTVPKRTEWNTSISVTSSLLMKAFAYNEHIGTLGVSVKLSMIWRDEFLVWNASSYDGIESLQIPSYTLWLPNIAVHYNNAGHMDPLNLPNNMCLVRSGRVHCIVPLTLYIACQTDHTYWPYDTHNCIATIRSASETRMKLSMQIFPIPIRRSEDNIWDIELRTTIVNPKFSYSKFVLGMKRISAGEWSFMLAPALVIIMLNLLSMWLSPLTWHRYWILCINAHFHSMFLLQMAWFVPSSGYITPNIIRYFIISLWVTSGLILLAVCNRAVALSHRNIPNCIINMANQIYLMIPCIKCFFISEYLNYRANTHGKTTNVAKGYSSVPGTVVTKWIDRIVFVLLLIMYVVMINNFVPSYD